MNYKNAPFSPQIFDQLPGCWGCKDISSTFVYANPEYAKMIGFDNHLDCIGKTDHQMPATTAESAEQYVEQDSMVVETGRTIRVLDIHPYHDGKWRAHLFTKTPWRDHNNHIIGTIFSGIELKDTAVLEVGHWLCRAIGLTKEQQDPSQLKINIKKEDIGLNTRESEVLFLLLYGKKPQYIAKTLGVAVKTIENYVLRLREKFNANSKGELLDLALELGYGSNIPESMLRTQLSIVLKD
ncbi:PAS domain-containing protein [Photobacterium leiognathi subsp. mandapamensis]|uniref:helix-turn-helix transcriptional regulator n=1 Tax=Photobacterium leiognathi TaxID=553611 RepID=UPI003AF3DAD0